MRHRPQHRRGYRERTILPHIAEDDHVGQRGERLRVEAGEPPHGAFPPDLARFLVSNHKSVLELNSLAHLGHEISVMCAVSVHTRNRTRELAYLDIQRPQLGRGLHHWESARFFVPGLGGARPRAGVSRSRRARRPSQRSRPPTATLRGPAPAIRQTQTRKRSPRAHMRSTRSGSGP